MSNNLKQEGDGIGVIIANTNKQKPYIGITDFQNSQQVESMRKLFRELFKDKQPRSLMIGTMMSYKTLHGLSTKWADVFPKGHEFDDIYPHKGEIDGYPILNALHYADYENLTKVEDLVNGIFLAGSPNSYGICRLDALQLDMVWPSVSLISETVEKVDKIVEGYELEKVALFNLKIILQVSKKSMGLCDNDPKKVAAKIKEYGCADFVLFDQSMGKGQAMDAGLLKSYLMETKERCPDIGLAIAGGLGPTSMHLIEPIIELFPDISIDAQGQLRKSGNALDPIDWDRAGTYLREAAKIFT